MEARAASRAVPPPDAGGPFLVLDATGDEAFHSAEGRRLAQVPVEGQVFDLGAADLDGDGREELIVLTGGYRLLVLRDTGAAAATLRRPH